MSPTGPEVLRPDWPVPPRVRAAFTLRSGGASGGPWASLNLGAHVGDEPAAVAENRRRVREALGLPSEPLWLSQVHGSAVFCPDRAPPVPGLPPGSPPGAVAVADAALTGQPGRVLAILVADCLPVLFAARDGSRVGAAHAGWRGLAGGVLEGTVAALAAAGVPPSGLLAWIGPAIGPDRFEVGEEVRTAFVGADAAAAMAFRRNDRGRWQCDLRWLAARRLAGAGVAAVYGAAAPGPGCTYDEPRRFFSYRRDGQCGRMAALVWLE